MLWIQPGKTTRALGRLPPKRSQSKVTIQTGTVAMSSAAIPDGTYNSAQHTRPLPPSSMNVPITAADFHCAAVGRGVPRKRTKAYINAPATRKRTAAIRNGGSVSTAKRIASYVEPHTRYTVANAAATRSSEAEDVSALRAFMSDP